MKNTFFIMDVFNFLRPNFSLELKNKPILVSIKGIVIYIDKEKLKEFRRLVKTNKVVHNPLKHFKLSLLDIRSLLSDLNVNIDNILIVDTSLFIGEQEMAPVFRSEEFIKYHLKSNDQVYNIISESDIDFKQKAEFYKKHIPERLPTLVYFKEDLV